MVDGTPKQKKRGQEWSQSKEIEKHNMHLSRLAAVGQIAAGIAHEVRNPLTAVKGFLQLLQEQSPHPYLEIAQKELDNAISTLQNLLQVAKPDVDDEPFQRLSLCIEIESLLSLFQEQFYRIELVKEFKDVEVEIYGKRNQLKKAFFNILKNAVEAIPGKGTITIRHFYRDRAVHVEISDTGVGIPKEKLMLLGTPFFTTKEEGTGMGLAQVFSTIYEHGGTMEVESEEFKGTTFLIRFPLDLAKNKGVKEMELVYEPGMTLKDFLFANKERFEETLLTEASHVKDLVEEIKSIGKIDLLSNVHILVIYLIENKHYEIINLAREEGKRWANNPSLNLAVKLEYFQIFRQVLWDFLYNYDRLHGKKTDRKDFFDLERQINTSLDIFLRHFFISFTETKEDIIKAHREMIDELSVCILQVSTYISILPLIGSIDVQRAKTLQEKVLAQIGKLKTRMLLIDMSGVAFLDEEAMKHLIKIFDGILLMGCEIIITGIHSVVAHMMVNLGISLDKKIQIKGTLQQALEEFGLKIREEY